MAASSSPAASSTTARGLPAPGRSANTSAWTNGRGAMGAGPVGVRARVAARGCRRVATSIALRIHVSCPMPGRPLRNPPCPQLRTRSRPPPRAGSSSSSAGPRCRGATAGTTSVVWPGSVPSATAAAPWWWCRRCRAPPTSCRPSPMPVPAPTRPRGWRRSSGATAISWPSWGSMPMRCLGRGWPPCAACWRIRARARARWIGRPRYWPRASCCPPPWARPTCARRAWTSAGSMRATGSTRCRRDPTRARGRSGCR